MNKLIGALSLVFAITLLSLTAQCNNGAEANKDTKTQETSSQTSNVQAYYFHGTRRCATCQAVETVTEEAIKEYFGEKVSFTSINSEEDEDNPMLAQYEISGQTLLIIKGDEVIDLTNDAFMNARTNPDKFKAKIKTTIDSIL